MVMENEIRLGDIMDKLTPSDRVVIYNAARQVVYRGYAANAVHGTLNPLEQFTQYRVEDLQHILYIRIELKSEFEQ